MYGTLGCMGGAHALRLCDDSKRSKIIFFVLLETLSCFISVSAMSVSDNSLVCC